MNTAPTPAGDRGPGWGAGVSGWPALLHPCSIGAELHVLQRQLLAHIPITEAPGTYSPPLTNSWHLLSTYYM